MRDWKIDYNSFFLTPEVQGNYNEGTLYKSLSIDENQKQVIEYINKSGQVVLKKVQLEDNPNDASLGWICTYNVYDDFGRLRCVISPEAVNWLYYHNWGFYRWSRRIVSFAFFTSMMRKGGR